jgi:hypothetical protein
LNRTTDTLVTRDEAALIVPLISPFFRLLVQRYQEEKYPPEVYKQLLKTFTHRQDVQPADIQCALYWKYGKKASQHIPKYLTATIERIAARWAYFCSAKDNPERIRALQDPTVRASDFVSRAFIVHLADPKNVPIIDRFNHRAVRCLLRFVRPDFALRNRPRSYDDILLVHSFIEQIRYVWRDGPTSSDLDRYLMMYGKHVAPRYPH